MEAPPTPDHPFRPQLTVRVGIVGHRWDKLKRRDAELVKKRMDLVFSSIEEVVDDIVKDDERIFGYRSSNPDAPPLPADHPANHPVLRVLSGLAEGTDRLGVEVARARPGKHKWQLTAMLPFARDTYQKDFVLKKKLEDGTEAPLVYGETGYGEPDPESVAEYLDLLLVAQMEGGIQELDGQKEEKKPHGKDDQGEKDKKGGSNAYRPLAVAICRNSDVLIAVWDGKPAKTGGTGEIVQQAGELGIPVVRIPPDGVDNPWVHDPEAGNQGRGDGLRKLSDHFRRLLVAPDHRKKKEERRRDLREKYFAEKKRGKSIGRFYDWFFSLLAPRKGSRRSKGSGEAELNIVDALRRKWAQEWKDQGVCDEVVNGLLATNIHRHYAWASHLANYYGGLYRTAFLANYTLAWFAVGAAAFGVVFHEAGNPRATLGAAFVEVLLLMLIISIVIVGGRWRLHARWIDYRRLAEWIRVLPMLLPLSRTPALGVDPFLASQESWVDWMCRAVVREAGVLPLDLSHHLPGAKGMIAKGVLKGQITYHQRAAERNGTVDGVLHLLTVFSFVFALVLAGVHLVDLVREARGGPAIIPPTLADVLLIPALVLPALGGALHGLRSQGEFDVTATRSERIQERLEELEGELEKVKELSVENLGKIAVKTATVMNAELSAWLLTYQTKGIPIP